MTEEQVTKAILSTLIESGWTIVTYDYPQSGSGKMLHPNESGSTKNKGGIIPDIVTVKGTICLFFENKDRVVVADFKKVFSLINDNQYTKDIASLLRGHNVRQIFYGVGFPKAKWSRLAISNLKFVDFVVGVTEDNGVEFLHNPSSLTI